jgi:hypothetical protein
MSPRLRTAFIWIALLGLAYFLVGGRAALKAPSSGGEVVPIAPALDEDDEDDQTGYDAVADAVAAGLLRVARVSVCVSVSAVPMNGCSFNCAILRAF